MTSVRGWIHYIPICLFFPLLAGEAAYAAPVVSSITASPTSTQLSLKPGETIRKSFEVINSSTTAYLMTTSVAPYSVQGDGYTPRFVQPPGTPDVTSWVHFRTGSTTITAHKIVIENYSVSVPLGTAPGGYYAVLFAEANPVVQAPSGVTAHTRVGDILYITVAGSAQTGGTVRTVQIPLFDVANSIPLGVKVSNTGATHFLSTATTAIKNAFGKELYRTSLTRYVLPHTTRLISSEWLPSAPLGLYQVQQGATVASTNHTSPNQWVILVQPWLLRVTALAILLGVFLFNALWLIKKYRPPAHSEK